MFSNKYQTRSTAERKEWKTSCMKYIILNIDLIDLIRFTQYNISNTKEDVPKKTIRNYDLIRATFRGAAENDWVSLARVQTLPATVTVLSKQHRLSLGDDFVDLLHKT